MLLDDDDEGEDKMTLPINNMRVAVEKVEPAPPPQLPVVGVGVVDVVCAARDRFLLPNCCGALDAAVVAVVVLCLLHATAGIVQKS